MRLEDHLKGVPARLELIEKSLGLNKTKISEQAGITRSAYSNIATGAQTPSAEFIFKICITHNISADFLIFGEGQIFRADNELLSGVDSDLEELYLQLIKRMLKMSLDSQIKIVKVIDATLDLIPDEEKKD